MVSVIIPVYNVEKYLRQCVESVLNQTYTDFELILVDDGSTDSSGKLCDDYALKDKRVTVIHGENRGVSVARNTGMDASHGEYIYFLDSDDYIRKDALEKLVSMADETDSDFVYFEAEIFFDGTRKHPLTNTHIRSKDYGTMSGSDAALELYNNREFKSSVQRCFLKMDFLTKHRLRFYPGILHEDELFTVTAFIKADKVTHLREILYFRRKRPGSIMTSKYSGDNFHGCYVCIKELSKLYAECDKNGKARIFLKGYLSEFSQNITLRYFFRLDKNEREQCRSEFEEFKKLLSSVDCFGNKSLKLNLKFNFPLKRFPILYKIAVLPEKIIRRSKSKLKIMVQGLYIFVLPQIYLKRAFDRNISFLVLTPVHGNLGDHAIAISAKMLLDKNDINYLEISGRALSYLERRNKLSFFNRNNIFVTGGGFLGTLWPHTERLVRNLISANPDSSIILFPNTLYFEDSAYGKSEYENSKRIYNSHPNLKIYAREKRSYELLQRIGVKSALVPDMAMLLKKDTPSGNRSGCVLLLRGDHERTRSDETDKIINDAVHKLFGDNVKYSDTVVLPRIPFFPASIPFSRRKRVLEKKYRELKKAELVITDRLHGMILSAITGTPCIVLNSKSPKVLGCYEWIKYLDYIKVCTDPNDIPQIYAQMPHGNQIYDNSRLIPLFADLFDTIDELKH